MKILKTEGRMRKRGFCWDFFWNFKGQETVLERFGETKFI